MTKFLPKFLSASKFLLVFQLLLISISLPISVNAAGLVPCGGAGENACDWCFLMQMFKKIIDFAIYIIFPIAAIMIVIGGGFIMTAAGSPARVSKGKEIITAAIIGLAIALLSYLIIDTIIKVIAGGWSNLNIGPWNQLKCS